MQPFTMVDTEIVMPNREEGEFWRASYWDAVAARDRAMDGVFFYAVMSTGVYCRPSCPSKRPRRENVVFFRAREAAERAGFRPCKRCKPDKADGRDPNAQLVENVCRYIDTHPDEPVTLEALGRALGISPFYLQRTFKALTGITPRAYADSRRLHSLKAGLREGHSVTRSLYDAGYGSSSRLYERASSQLGMTPSRAIASKARARRFITPSRPRRSDKCCLRPPSEASARSSSAIRPHAWNASCGVNIRKRKLFARMASLAGR